MESGRHQSSISTLKVEFHCSKDCPRDVKKRLQGFAGVESVGIDVKQGLVTVKGKVNNPMELVKLIQKMGKKAQLWSFQKAPLPPQHTYCRGCHHHSRSDHTDSCEAHRCKHPQPHCKYEKKSNKHGLGRGFYIYEKPKSFAFAPPPPPPMRFYCPPPSLPPSTLMPTSCMNPMVHYASYADNFSNYR